MISVRALILACIFTVVCVSTCLPQTKRRVLHYEPEEVTLTGVLISRTFYGPPNYGENPTTDSKETQYILIVDSPIDVIGDPDNEINRTVRGIKRITLVIDDFKVNPVKALLRHRVEVRGTLFHSHTGHHHTKILITVTSLRKANTLR